MKEGTRGEPAEKYMLKREMYEERRKEEKDSWRAAEEKNIKVRI